MSKGLFAGAGSHLADATIVGTILVPLHNHARFVAACLAGVAAAWRPGLEILLVDDASSDEGYATAIRILASHPAIPVTTMRTAASRCHGNAQEVLQLTRGRFVIQCDSDDVPMPDRFAEIMACFADDPACRLVTSNAMTISEDGLPLGLYDTHWAGDTFADPSLASDRRYDTRWLGATAAYHRDIFEAFPPIDPELCPYGLDLVTPLRAMLLGRHRYIVKPLVSYRLHATNAHRVAGAYGGTHRQRERYEAFMLMVLAQKLRDLRAPVVDGADVASLLHGAHEVFFATFDAWARETVQASRETVPAAASALPAVPPIVTLRPGETLDLHATAPFAAIVQRWSGFHAAEDWGCWLARSSLVALRLCGSKRHRLVLSVHTSACAKAQRLSVRIGTEPWVEVLLGPVTCSEISLDLPDCGSSASIMPLIIISHDAAIHRDHEADSADNRLIGAALRHIRLAARSPTHDERPLGNER